jgi:hypothetical protein
MKVTIVGRIPVRRMVMVERPAASGWTEMTSSFRSVARISLSTWMTAQLETEISAPLESPD